MLKTDFAFRDARLPRVQFTSINVNLTRGRFRAEFLPRNYHFLTLYNPTSSAQSFGLAERLVLPDSLWLFCSFFRAVS
jgi:hypothetical protein